MSHAEAAFASRTPEEASLNFFAALEGLGASYLQTRLYRRPSMTLTSASQWAAGGFITRVAPDAWPGSPAFDYVCLECNPLLTAIRESQTRYRFSDFAPRQDRNFDTYWDAIVRKVLCRRWRDRLSPPWLSGTGFCTGGELCDPDGRPCPDRAPDQSGDAASSNATQTVSARARLPGACRRGQDQLGISVIIGISEATVRFHIDNARRKLGAVNRAQAVARLVNQRLI